MSASIVSDVSIFFFNDTATTEIYTLSLHDALPISRHDREPRDAAVRRRRAVPVALADVPLPGQLPGAAVGAVRRRLVPYLDRKSTRLNSSHANISYAVFCLKKKKDNTQLLLVLLLH